MQTINELVINGKRYVHISTLPKSRYQSAKLALLTRQGKMLDIVKVKGGKYIADELISELSTFRKYVKKKI